MPKKKKLTKAEKLALKKEAEERKRQEAELALKLAEEEERLRLEQERLYQEELEKIRLEEAEIREKQQLAVAPLFDAFEEKSRLNRNEDWKELQWFQYVNVWREINPLSLPMVNAFLCTWKDEDENVRDFFINYRKSLKIIDAAETALFNCPELNEKMESQWNEIITNTKRTINEKIDLVSFETLRNAADHISSDSYNMEYGITDLSFEKLDTGSPFPAITLCVWVNLAKNLRYKGMELHDLGISFELPHFLAMESCAVRILHTSFDAITHCTMDEPEIPEEPVKDFDDQDFLVTDEIADIQSEEEQVEETEQVSLISKSISKESAHSRSSAQIPVAPERESSVTENSSTDALPQSESSTMQENQESSLCTSSSATLLQSGSDVEKKKMSFGLPEPVEIKYVNWNEYFTVGGIYQFDLFKVPMQPVEVGSWILIYHEEKALKRIPYHVNITPIRPPQPHMSPTVVAEFCDAEIKRFDKEMSTAISLSIRLSEEFIYIEQPRPAFWCEDKQYFTTCGIWNVNFQDSQLSFKVNRFGVLGLLERRYANHPLRKWHLVKDYIHESTILVLEGKILTVSVTISFKGCAIKKISRESNILFTQLYDIYLSPRQLVKELQKVGINIEILETGSNYLPFSMKDRSLEQWLHRCLSMLCPMYDFSWSKWNRQLSAERLVLQVFDSTNSSQKKLILVDCERAVYLSNSENDEFFTIEALPQQKFFSDLYNLLTEDIPKEELEECICENAVLIKYMYEFLELCRPFSCS